jgi:hypothetical protein
MGTATPGTKTTRVCDHCLPAPRHHQGPEAVLQVQAAAAQFQQAYAPQGRAEFASVDSLVNAYCSEISGLVCLPGTGTTGEREIGLTWHAGSTCRSSSLRVSIVRAHRKQERQKR